MPTSLLEGKGLVLKRAVQVAQNGAFNKLRGRYNPLEVWEVPCAPRKERTSESPKKKKRLA